ncbi:MAG: hypothetical protein ABI664_16720 [bacterium]
MSTFIRRTTAIALSASALALVAPDSAQAQGGPGPRWLGWHGCWTAAPSGQVIENGPAPRTVCITPTRDADVVDIAAIADGKILTRDRIDASGRPQAIDGTACKGTQTARWSSDGHRVFLKSSVACEGVQTEMSAILAITASGNWLDVRRVAAGEGTDVRVARYRDIGIPRDVPSEIASALDTRGNFIAQDARTDNGSPVGVNAIIEASRLVDASVVEAWIFESGQRYAVDARTLRQLADAGVPAGVTDAMVSVEKEAQLANRSERDVYYYSPYGWNTYGHYGRGSADAWNQGTSSRTTTDYYESGRSHFVVNVYTTYDPWGYGYWPYGGYRYGYAPFGYGFRYGRGELIGFDYFNPYGSYWGRAYPAYLSNARNRVGYTYPPVIVLHNDPTNTAPRGRSVKGEGYTPGRPGDRPSNDDPRTARPRTERATERAAVAVVEAARTDATERRAQPRTEAPPRREARPAEARPESRPETRSAEHGDRSERSAPSSAPRTAKARP